jgi:hypothetical protein
MYVINSYFNFDKMGIYVIVEKLMKPFGKSWRIRMATYGEESHGQ